MKVFKVKSIQKADWKLVLPSDTVSTQVSSCTTKAANKIAAFLEDQLIHYVIINDTITIVDPNTSVQYCDGEYSIVHYVDDDYEVELVDIDNETIKNY